MLVDAMHKPKPAKLAKSDAAASAAESQGLAIDVQDLHVVRREIPIVDGVSCQLARGQCMALLGPNGCGKSTFAQTLTGQTFATAGRVSVLGQTLGQTDVRALRKRIGIVNTAPAGSGGSHRGVVVDGSLSTIDAVCTGFFATVGLYEQVAEQQREHAMALLGQVGLGHRLDLRFAQLSTGEQRRAIIARALVHRPELLILDEPTNGLDLAGREQVLATIEMILASPDPPAVLFITHHVEELSPRTAQVVLMREGKFVATGSPEKIITPEALSEVFGCKVYVRRVHGRYWLEVLPEAWLDLIDANPNKR